MKHMKPFSKHQKLMLLSNDEDIAAGRLISQGQLDKEDLQYSKNTHLTSAQKAELERRHLDYQRGIAKTYTWEETVDFIDKRLKEKNHDNDRSNP